MNNSATLSPCQRWPAALMGLILLMAAGPIGATGLHLPEETLWRPVELARSVVGHQGRIEIAWPSQGGVPLPPGSLDEQELEGLVRRYLQELESVGVRSVWVGARAPQDWPKMAIARGQMVPLNELLPTPEPVPRRPWEEAESRAAIPPPPPPPATIGNHGWTGDAQAGGLAGRTVYISSGHGWYWSTNLGRWATQRGNTHDIVEDFVNAEAVNHYLIPMLRNAGAAVVTVREHDMQPAMVVVDEGDGSSANGAGYSETGPFQAGTAEGFANGKAPYSGKVNPFALGTYRAAPVVKGKPTGTATFLPALPKAGMYAVHVGYTSGSNRSKDAHFEIRHSGGSSHRRVNMQRHGQTWVSLGTFHFNEGVDLQHGAVLLHNDTLAGPTTAYIVADVIRFGGGEGLIVRGDGKAPTKGPTSGRPRWEECARYHAQYSGAPPTVWDPSAGDNKDDVTTRSRFAAWHRETGEDAVFVSWHSNAPDPGRGTSTYVYGPNPPDGSYQFSGIKGSDQLAKLLQKSLVDDVRAVFEPAWKDRGVRSAWFGELNPKNNPEMPSALVEVAFHSTKADADFMREPRFRHLQARAFYKAIVRYFAQRDGIAVKLSPEPPRGLRLRALGPKVARISWQPGETGGVFGDPTSWYLVQRSVNGRGFDDGQIVQGTEVDLPLTGPGEPLFVRVLGVNDGGISLPSVVLGASGGCGEQAQALVVQGFTRLAASLMPLEDLSPWSLGTVQRLRQWRMNRFDYAVEHVQALAAAGVSVDGMDRQALAALKPADLSGYGLLDWAAGEQSTVDGVWTEAERGLLKTWLQGGAGRALLASGAEIAWAVDHKGSASSADWLATWFGAGYEEDDAGTYGVVASPGSSISMSQAAFDSGDQHTYDVDYPDVLKLAGASALLDYADGKGIAAVGYLVGNARTALVGFPLETVWPQVARHALFAALVSHLAVATEPAPCPSAVADEDSDASSGADAGDELDSGGSGDAGAQADGGSFADALAADDAQVGGDGGARDVTAPVTSGLAPADSGCGCQVGHDTGKKYGAMLLLLCLGSLILGRRRWRAPPAI